jgi:hypothetical protein
MKGRIILALVMLGMLMVPVSASAGSKNKTFNVPADVLYESAVQTAANTEKLTSSDEGHKRFSFRTGASMSSWGLIVNAVVREQSGNSSELVLDIQNSDSRQMYSWGAGGRVADDFFKKVEIALGSWRTVAYSLQMTKPVNSDELSFEDDFLKVHFTLSRKGVNFSIKNKTDDPIKIDWNQWSYVDTDGKSHRVFHSGIKFTDKESSLAPSVIPPTAMFEDVVCPSDHAKFSEIGGGYQFVDLLPQSSSATEFVGKTISLFMPLELHNSVKNYFFSFKIKDAQVTGGSK